MPFRKPMLAAKLEIKSKIPIEKEEKYSLFIRTIYGINNLITFRFMFYSSYFSRVRFYVFPA